MEVAYCEASWKAARVVRAGRKTEEQLRRIEFFTPIDPGVLPTTVRDGVVECDQAGTCS